MTNDRKWIEEQIAWFESQKYLTDEECKTLEELQERLEELEREGR